MLRQRGNLVSALKHLDSALASTKQQLRAGPQRACGGLANRNFALQLVGFDRVYGSLAFEATHGCVAAFDVEGCRLRHGQDCGRLDFECRDLAWGDPAIGNRALLAALGKA